jgi:iron complex transport system substrate-binding protein
MTLRMTNIFKLGIILVCFTSAGCRSGIGKTADKAENQGNKIEKAERFTLEDKAGWTEVKIIDPWQGAAGVTQIYKLVKRGSHLPQGMDTSNVIYIPIRKIICMSTTHLSMIAALGEENSVVGMSGTNFVYSPVILNNIKKGLVAEIGYEANLNKEMILKIAPDLIMIYGIGSESSGYLGKVKELGLKVIINADYLETDPLGRAEWIKLFGALYGRQQMADSIYKSEAEQYNNLKAEIGKSIKNRPKVLLGLPFKDTWYISPGNSFISRLIEDSGGDYLWKDTRSASSMPYGLENVYLRALKADFWLNIGSSSSKNEISNVDQRLNDLPCFKSGNLFNNNNRITPEGGNDFWESGCLYPHFILRDIATILHPEIYPGNELFYYRKLN